MAQTTSPVTVVIATRNRAATLLVTLAELERAPLTLARPTPDGRCAVIAADRDATAANPPGSVGSGPPQPLTGVPPD